jgi:hypothetical protein
LKPDLFPTKKLSLRCDLALLQFSRFLTREIDWGLPEDPLRAKQFMKSRRDESQDRKTILHKQALSSASELAIAFVLIYLFRLSAESAQRMYPCL